MLQSLRFLKSKASYQEASVVLFGVPMDYTVCFRPGARFGPSSIRQASQGIEHFSLQFQSSLMDRDFYDAGDLVLPFGNVDDSLLRIEKYVSTLLEIGKLPFAIGGEHLITLPIVRTLYQHDVNLHVIHIDAHADLADQYFGEMVTHATVMRRVLDFLPHEQFFQFGIRSADREEAEFASTLHHYPFQVFEPLQQVLARLSEDTPLYVSLDVDVLDPSYAPGTGTPESGGISPQELFSVFTLLKGRNIVGADLVEIAPQIDPTNNTSVLGAKIIREMLLTLFEHAATTINTSY